MHDAPQDDTFRLLRESVRRFVEKEVVPNAHAWEAQGFVPRETLRQMGRLGFLGLRYPEEYGGGALDARATALLAEELGRSTFGGFAITVLVHTDMASPHLVNAGSPEQIRRYLPGIVSGELITAVAVTEPDAGSDVKAIRTTARRDGGDYVLKGSKMFITNGARADFIVLVTKTDPSARHDGITLFIVDLKDEAGDNVPGFSVSRTLEKMGMHASDTAELSFEDVRVPAENLLGQEGKGFYHISWELQGERLVGAVGSVAGAERAFEKTLEYAKEREAFGRPIGKFQAIRHKFAEMAMKIEAAKQMVYSTAWRFNNGEYPVREITMAKLFAARIGCEVADECIQIHGGYGYMKEYDVERAYRDSRLNRIGAGSDEIMLDVIGRSYGI